jgi:predicted TIM-barrel fold metal-dependent hydrolase
MLSRREVLKAFAAGATFSGHDRPALEQRAAAVSFDVPRGACDCHAHIFGDPQRFPFTATRSYTPPLAPVDALRTLHDALHIDRVVIVHPSVYGTDNACTLDALRQFGSRARAVAVIDDKTPEPALTEMRAAGVRGIRVNLGTLGVTDPTAARARFQAALQRAQRYDWHIQIYTQPSVIRALRDDLLASPLQIVFDHFGGAQASAGLDAPGVDTLRDLVSRGKAYVKISAPYRSSSAAPDYPDMAPFAKALIAENPAAILWGTDWPHPDSNAAPGRKPTDIAPFLPVDDVRVLDQLAVWAPDAGVRRKILVENPVRLYGF